MIGVKSVAIHRPEDVIDNFEQASRLDASEEFISSKIGMHSLVRKTTAQETTDLALEAVKQLFAQQNLLKKQVECLILVTQNPDGMGLPHASAILHHKLGLPSTCTVFDISLGCSGFVQGLHVAKAFMESQGYSNGILVTCDPYSKIIDPNDRDTAFLFGDGATATWLNDSPDWKIGHADFGISSHLHEALTVSENGFLAMNGRAVFNFAATQVPASVDRALSKAHLNIDQIDMLLLHQGSRYIVETLAKRLGTEDKTPFVAMEYGNTVSSSIPMLLAENVPDTAQRLILCGFGVGLSWATCILEKNNA